MSFNLTCRHYSSLETYCWRVCFFRFFAFKMVLLRLNIYRFDVLGEVSLLSYYLGTDFVYPDYCVW